VKLALVSFALALVLTACGASAGGAGRPRDLATVRTILRQHGGELRRRYSGVVGFGIGAKDGVRAPVRPSDPVHLIVVYLRSRRDRPDGARSLEGVPIRFEVTGPIRAL
jgi:hypothetical protein